MSTPRHNPDELVFSGSSEVSEKQFTHAQPWVLLIVDDQQEIHDITRMVLANYTFTNRPLKIISAYSGEEAKKTFDSTSDIAVTLLDVVMETDTAGLEVVQHVREKCNNSLTRIILRTGQPGQAPEKQIIMEYDINDYKEKSELTSQKLFTAVTTALRSYRNFLAIEQSRNGLQQIVNATGKLFRNQSVQELAHGVLIQMTNLLNLKSSALYGRNNGIAIQKEPHASFKILAATGEFSELANKSLDDDISRDIKNKLQQAIESKESTFYDDCYVGYFRHKEGVENLFLLRNEVELKNLDKNLIDILASNVSLAFDNVFHSKKQLETQTEMIFLLSELIEMRPQEASNHSRRVAAICQTLAEGCGLSTQEVSLIHTAAAMHDVGKIKIPDIILTKEGPLTEEELVKIQQHTRLGHVLFQNSDKKLFQTIAEIAHGHHEHWDGNGYPDKIAGEKIPLSCRITAIADFFDAVTHKRSYAKAWSIEEAVTYIKDKSGSQFDPKLVQIFVDNIEEIKKSYIEFGPTTQ